MSQREQQEELHQVTTATDPPHLPTLLFQQQERNNKLNRCCFRKTKLLNWSSLSCTVNNKSQCYEHDLPFCYQPDLFQAGGPKLTVSMVAVSASQTCRQNAGFWINRHHSGRALNIWLFSWVFVQQI